MKTTTIAIGLVAVCFLAACTTPSGTSSGAGGGTTSTTTAPMGCPDPWLGYDPASPDGDYITSEPYNRFAARLAPVTSSMHCYKASVGIYVDGIDCKMPSTITIGASWEMMSVPVKSPSLFPLPVSEAEITEGETPGSFVLDFGYGIALPAESYPFVVVEMQEGLCLMTKEWICDATKSWLKVPDVSWAMVGDQLVMGLGDCGPEN